MSVQAALDEYLSRLGTLHPEPIADLFADTVDFYVPGSANVPWTGKRRSRPEIIEFYRILADNLLIDDFHIDNKFFADNAAIVVGHFACRFRSSGKEFKSPFMLRLEFQGDRISRYVFLEDTDAAVKAFVV